MTAAKRKRTMNRSILGGKLLVPAFLLALGQTQTVLARTEHALPLIMSASNRIQQGFVRIINHSNRAGTVVIHAIDDSGRRFGPASLSLDAKETAHFNSWDLERGNPSKGLSTGVGDGQGNWRLELETALDIEPLAYVRTSDGFLTSMHDVVVGGGSVCSPAGTHVPIFNPASNRSQRSRLRLFNPSDNSVNVTIIGRDDEGKAPAGDVRFDILPGAARTITAQDLESGAAGLDGRFGDGAGKWQLFVSADGTIQVMSLLQSPSGHLTNLSTTLRKGEATGSTSTSYDLQSSALRTDWRGLRPPDRRGWVVAVAYGDFDCDGDEDVFMAPGDGTANPTPVEMYANDGDGGFSLASRRFIKGQLPGLVHPRKALTGDFNRDGRLDVFVAGHGYDVHPFPGEHPVLLLSSESGLRSVGGLEYLVGFWHGAASADIDLDGDLDIFMTDTRQSVFLKNDGRGRFVRDVSAVPADLEGKNVYTTELIDVDEDGYPDLLVAGHEHENAPTAIYWGDRSGTYDASRKTTLPAVAGQGIMVDIDAEDLDGDGDRDVVLDRTGSDPFYSGYYIQLVFNRGSRRFTDETAQRITRGAEAAAHWIRWIRLEDVNEDGYRDIWVDGPVHWGLTWLNDGSGRFSKR